VACVRKDIAGADVVLAALGENTQRQDLTQLEVAKGYQQALDLGAKPATIARKTGAKPATIARKTGAKAADVRRALTVTASAAAVDAVTTKQATFEQAAAIASFEDGPEAVTELVEAVGNEWNFKHTLSRLTAAREHQATAAATTAALRAEGITVIAHPLESEDSDHPDAARLTDLVDGDGQPLDATAHAACPGHAVVINRYDANQADPWCTDPETHGHQARQSLTLDRGERKGSMTDEEKAERRLVIANNKAWRAAEPVRQEYVTRLLAKARRRASSASLGPSRAKEPYWMAPARR